jgi:hypothetical protein
MSSQRDGSTRQEAFTTEITLKHWGAEVMPTANMATRPPVPARLRFKVHPWPSAGLSRANQPRTPTPALAGSLQFQACARSSEPTRAKVITK